MRDETKGGKGEMAHTEQAARLSCRRGAFAAGASW